QRAPVDVVLVIDRSGSMNDGLVDEYVAITSDPSTNKNYYVKANGEYIQVSWPWIGLPNCWRYNKGFLNYRYVSWDGSGDDENPGSTNANSPVGKPFYERVGRSRLYYAKQAAINFSEKVLGGYGIPGSRVALITYNGPSKFNI